MPLPKEVSPGDAVSAADYNDLLGFVRSLMIQPGIGYLVAHERGGQLLRILPRRASAATLARLRLVVIAGATEKRVSVTEGLVNDVTPTLGGDELIDNPTSPATVPETGDLTVGANYIWVKTVGTFADPDTYVVTIEKTTTTTPPTAPEITATGFTSCRILARVDMAAETFARTITLHHAGGDLFVESFGSINYWWKV